MLIQWEKYFFTVNDIYGALRYDTQILKADVHCYFQQSHFIEVDKKTSLHKKTKTLCIDLTLPEEQLRKDMNRTTRYQINKAGRDQLSVQHIEAPTREDVLAFIALSLILLPRQKELKRAVKTR
ncbi:hypothetical protein P5G51_004975 [Virgibacillus sp. 179-BFC.A HS]|uniref:Uncharacterized protein n=1 Tax=Tigheibacillus jepli TaxID=3035914 RepID=A0ABU5CET6_9BACI|nr:hypothetical protein [Virgibacillus sp. 179-BFC.A HS]MDY0404839.1 hypothetical protein [Virgibacillus sp. 179-BFC.A HS]